jgi:hypothetical protein
MRPPRATPGSTGQLVEVELLGDDDRDPEHHEPADQQRELPPIAAQAINLVARRAGTLPTDGAR